MKVFDQDYSFTSDFHLMRDLNILSTIYIVDKNHCYKETN